MVDVEDSDEEYELADPTLQNLLDQESLKWIFVGGKGGVGKTTTACSIAVQLAAVRKSVLLISTDPAHNLSDSFGFQIGKRETLVKGFDNLYALEIDPTENSDAVASLLDDVNGAEGASGVLSELMATVPGIDEAMSFAELMRQVQRMNHDVIVFDTAPTGHTIRLLGFPELLENAMKKLIAVKDKFSGIFSQMSSILTNATNSTQDQVLSQLEQTQKTIQYVNAKFKDPEVTTFVCVCIPEFLSLFETERLIQKLTEFGIDSHCLVVNQVLFPEKGSTCRKCASRVRMQSKYLKQINDLYEDFNVVTMPQMDAEVRGIPSLRTFSAHLMASFDPEKDSQSFAPEEAKSN